MFSWGFSFWLNARSVRAYDCGHGSGRFGLSKVRGWVTGELGLGFLAFGVFVVAVVLHVRFWPETLMRISTDSMTIHADFDTFWRSAAALWTGGDAYDTGASLVNLNPPFWTVLLAPFGLMEAFPAYRLFSMLMFALAAGCLIWTAREVKLRAGWTVVAVVLLLASSPLLATSALGQLYPILTLGLVACWTFERRGKPVLAGVALGLTVAIKPSLLPVLLWPVARLRWGMLGAAMASGAAATILGVVVLGLGATFDWVDIVLRESLSTYWDNASLPAAAARLFTENRYAAPLADAPWMVSLAYSLGILAVFVTAAKVRDDGDAGLWALVAAALLASPIAWHNYLVLLGPGILVLMARGRWGVGLVLIALQTIPPQWPLLWAGKGTTLASLGLTFYLLVLALHWLAFLFAGEKRASPATGAVVEEQAL